MTSTALVPFGKYKGQPIEALAQDQAYCEWLAGQDWFRTRYTAIHTLIVNNFAEPHETPEHNALQVLFTEPAWIEAFVWAWIGPHWWPQVLTRAFTRTRTVCEQAIAGREKRIAAFADGPKDRWRVEQAEELNADLAALREHYRRRAAWLGSNPRPRLKITELAYEQRGADVEFAVTLGILEKHDEPEGSCFQCHIVDGYQRESIWLTAPQEQFLLRVECKPTLGDDYPAVLRQMLAHESNVLLIGRGGYQGVGATYDQVTKMFSASRIRVMLLADVKAP